VIAAHKVYEVQTTRGAHEPEDVERDERDAKTDDPEPEVNLSELLVQAEAGDLRKPIRESREVN